MVKRTLFPLPKITLSRHTLIKPHPSQDSTRARTSLYPIPLQFSLPAENFLDFYFPLKNGSVEYVLG